MLNVSSPHSDPKRASHLADILRRGTVVPIEDLVDRLQIPVMTGPTGALGVGD